MSSGRGSQVEEEAAPNTYTGRTYTQTQDAHTHIHRTHIHTYTGRTYTQTQTQKRGKTHFSRFFLEVYTPALNSTNTQGLTQIRLGSVVASTCFSFPTWPRLMRQALNSSGRSLPRSF